VFVRATDLAYAGDIWTVGADGHDERRITTDGRYSNLAVEGRRIACIGEQNGDVDNDNVYVLGPPRWRPERVATGGGFDGTPCWRPGRNQLFVGRSYIGRRHVDADAGDGGLWLVDLVRHSARQVLPGVDADFGINNSLVVSPGGTRIASEGGGASTGDGGYWLQMLDPRTWRPIRLPGERSLEGGEDCAWLDEDNLLLAGCPYGFDNRAGEGGIRRLNVRTRRFTRWLYSARSNVHEIRRSPRGDRFAVVVGKDTPRGSGESLVLVDRRTKARRTLSTQGAPGVCGFSNDGTQLLVIERPIEGEGVREEGDAYVLDLKRGSRRLIARRVLEAAWLESR
jgi:hypothetical protein